MVENSLNYPSLTVFLVNCFMKSALARNDINIS